MPPLPGPHPCLSQDLLPPHEPIMKSEVWKMHKHKSYAYQGIPIKHDLQPYDVPAFVNHFSKFCRPLESAMSIFAATKGTSLRACYVSILTASTRHTHTCASQVQLGALSSNASTWGPRCRH